ncbi:MAG: helix-turn-helix transcriptional regulator [Acidimicrobiales bacterium]|nr:helix-turn-helix transcriptional regulator [Acidimicrobiales bacterium]
MVTAASVRRMRRRGGRRQKAGTTPAAMGKALREAREASSVTLTEINDRTGVPWQQLEALEAGNFSRFHDLRSALTAVRRYCDLVDLDVERFERVVEEHWGDPLAGFDPNGAPHAAGRNGGGARNAYITTAVPTGHLSRYPGDGTHLRAFTQTDEVPGIKRVPPAADSHAALDGLSDTGSFPVAPGIYTGIRPAPLVLRSAVWFTAALLALALGGLAAQHYQPQWLKDIHLVHHTNALLPAAPSGSGTPGTTNSTGGSTKSKKPSRPGLVSMTATGTASATVSVQASNYSVVVAAWAPCWTVVHSPQSFSPIFAATLQGGQVKVFDPTDGQLSVSVSASLVTMQVRVNGKTVPGWLFKPTSVPFLLNFSSSTTSS